MRSFSRLLIFLACAVSACATTLVGHIDAARNGDSFVFTSGRQKLEVRLVGVSCPVNLVNTLASQPLAREAKRFTQSFNTFGQQGQLKLEIVGRDIYGRYLGWVSTVDDQYSLNLMLLSNGLAELNPDYLNLLDRPTQADLGYSESQAAASRRGVWNVRGRINPSVFRQKLHLGE